MQYSIEMEKMWPKNCSGVNVAPLEPFRIPQKTLMSTHCIVSYTHLISPDIARGKLASVETKIVASDARVIKDRPFFFRKLPFDSVSPRWLPEQPYVDSIAQKKGHED